MITKEHLVYQYNVADSSSGDVIEGRAAALATGQLKVAAAGETVLGVIALSDRTLGKTFTGAVVAFGAGKQVEAYAEAGTYAVGDMLAWTAADGNWQKVTTAPADGKFIRVMEAATLSADGMVQAAI